MTVMLYLVMLVMRAHYQSSSARPCPIIFACCFIVSLAEFQRGITGIVNNLNNMSLVLII